MKTFAQILLALFFIAGANRAAAQGTAFTYQGRLDNEGAPANGLFDFRFKLYTDPYGDNQVGSSFLTNAVPTTNGLFTTAIDFGPGIFTNSTNWLEVDVRTNGTGAYTVLSPLQNLTPTPQAIFAETAGNLSGLVASTSLSGTYGGVLVLTNTGNSFTGNGANVTGVNATALNGLNANNFWQLGGNNVASGQFLGSTDDEPVELWVNDSPVLRLTPDNTGQGAPGIVGGSPANFAASGALGAFIGGGGATSYFGNPPQGNSVYGWFGAILGGIVNSNYANGGTLGGGFQNRVGDATSTGDGEGATVCGGQFNVADGFVATVVAGVDNQATGAGAFVGGGGINPDEGYAGNVASGLSSVIGGGAGNTASGEVSTVAGGIGNQATFAYATVGGGSNNLAGEEAAFVGGGMGNQATGAGAFVGGGGFDGTYVQPNTASGETAVVGGGELNSASGPGTFVGGGYRNSVPGIYAVVGGGYENQANGPEAAVGGGANNIAGPQGATVSGGFGNLASGDGAFVGGGGFDGGTFSGNTASGAASTVAGGFGNQAAGNYAAVGGGIQNSASGYGAVVMGGSSNAAQGQFSFAGGQRAVAEFDGAFVWADSNTNVFNPYALAGPQGFPNSFNVRCTAGFYIATGINSTNGQITSGIYVAGGGSGWNTLSDRHAKTHFSSLDGPDMLRRLLSVPVMSWNYKSQDASVRHIGPMAQDFNAAFEVGEPDKAGERKYINSLDEEGVALAAIQGLNQKLTEELKRRDAENEELKQRLQTLEKIVLGGRSAATP